MVFVGPPTWGLLFVLCQLFTENFFAILGAKSLAMNNSIFVPWTNVFAFDGTLQPGAKKDIFGSRSLFSPAVGDLQHPGAVFVWHHEHAKKLIVDPHEIGPKLANYMTQLNGTAVEHFVTGIELPKHDGLLPKLKEQLTGLYRESRHESPLGNYVINCLRNQHILSYSFIFDLVREMRFYPLVSKPQGQLKFEPVPAATDGSGIYVIREYAPGAVVGVTVYTGMSIDHYLRTIKAHFYRRKEHYVYRHHHPRGEDRGKWHDKLDQGYSYSVGILPIRKDCEHAHFFKQVKKLETYFIKALKPRDNASENEGSHENSLFTPHGDVHEDNNVITAEDQSQPDDDLPF